jgi:acetyl-CoA carboxylase carboxyltransferase component
MESRKARLFVNSPNALEGNEVSRCDTASAAFQSSEAGIVDVVAEEAELIAKIRELISLIPANNEDDLSYLDCDDDLNRVCADLEASAGDPALALPMISDSHIFFETKADYAKDMVTGFIRLNGMTVGAVANRTVLYDEEGNRAEEFHAELSARGCEKAAGFVRFCDAFNIPVLTLTNASGFKASKCTEKKIARAAAALTSAFAEATVPKVNVVTGSAYGSAYVTMNSKGLGADFVYAWPKAEVGMMDAKLAAKIMYADADAAVIKEQAKAYAELQNNVASAAKRGYVDTIIEAQDTRKYVIGAFEMLFTKREGRPDKKHGTN